MHFKIVMLVILLLIFSVAHATDKSKQSHQNGKSYLNLEHHHSSIAKPVESVGLDKSTLQSYDVSMNGTLYKDEAVMHKKLVAIEAMLKKSILLSKQVCDSVQILALATTNEIEKVMVEVQAECLRDMLVQYKQKSPNFNSKKGKNNRSQLKRVD